MYMNTADQRLPLLCGKVITILCADHNPIRQYVIDKVIGTGGFSILYIAHDIDAPHRYVALKELFPRGLDGTIAERREDDRIVIYDPMIENNSVDHAEIWRELEIAFAREAQMTVMAGAIYDEAGALLKQNNPDILRVEGPYLAENGNRYLVLDTYNGQSLSDFINGGWADVEQRGRTPNIRLSDIIDILVSVLKKLSALHGDKRMYHLDLSDANIYLSKRLGGTDWEPYIIDYGSAYSIEQMGEDKRIAHRYTCNPYSAPEVVALSETQSEECGYRVDASSDLYSIAAILFYAVLGEHYTPDMIYSSGWKRRIRLFYPSAVYGNFADDLISFYEVALAPSQLERFRTAAQLITALQQLDDSLNQKGLLNAVHPDELMAALVLYRYPLYEYASENGDLNVLCLGGGELVRRMILTMISTGQMPDRKLRIHVVSENAEDCRADLLQRAPELIHYSNIGKSADVVDEYVWFSFETVRDLAKPQLCKQIAERYHYCKYVMVSTGSNNRNVDLARRYAAALGLFSQSATVIHYYMGEDAAMNVRSSVSTDQVLQQFSLHPFSLQTYAQDAAELGKDAFRVHYLYHKRRNSRVSRAAIMKEFAEDGYAQKSSIATALHIRYKLAGIGIQQNSERKQTIALYLQALETQKNRLLELEHRRWMMFMIADGYMLPNMTTMESYSFEPVDGMGYNKGFKCKNQRYHHCLVPCNNSGIILRDLPRYEWDKYTSYDEIDATDFDPLDKMSLKVHLLARQKMERPTRRKNVLNILENIAATIPMGVEELSAVFEYFANWLVRFLESPMPARLSERLQHLQNVFARYGIGITHWCKKLEDELSVYVEFGAYVDYKVPDETVIDNLLWLYYAQEDISLIKLTSEQVIDNIVPPLLIEPRQVCYLGNMSYEKELHTFFEQHGNNTKPTIVSCNSHDQNTICEKLFEQILKMESPAVIDVTGASELQIKAAMLFSTKTNTPVICCDAVTQTVTDLYGFEMASMYRFRNSISAKEIYGLLGGTKPQTVEADYVMRLNAHINSLWEFYLEYQEKWDMISAFFAVYGQGTSEICIPSFKIDSNAQYERYTNRMSAGKYNEIGADKFFRHLDRLKVIRELVIRVQPRYVTVSFEYPVSEGSVGLVEAVDRLFEFDFGRVQLIDRSRQIGERKYCIELSSGLHVCAEQRTFRGSNMLVVFATAEMLEPLMKLDELGLIELDLRKWSEYIIEFDFVYDVVKECMAKSENLLEAYVWCKAYETGYFDDISVAFGIEPGVSEAVEDKPDIVLTKGLKSVVVGCNMESLDRAHLQAIKRIADRLGANTKPVIICTSDVSEVVRKTAKDLDVHLIDQKTIAEHEIGSVLISIFECK